MAVKLGQIIGRAAAQEEIARMKYTPTRIDIRTEGWTSGLDVLPLPRECQTATCIHKDHQLSKAKADAELDAEWIRNAALEEMEKPNRGWAAPSSIFTDLMRTHIETTYRKWWHFGAFSETKREVVCQDMECDKEHTSSLPLDPPLDLPTISIKRGGLRFCPEFPECSFHIVRRGMFWQIEVRYHGTQTWHKPPQLRYWRRRTAESVRAWFMSHQQGMRAIYIERVNAR